VSPTREEFDSWIEGYLEKRHPELVEPLLSAIEAFDAVANGGPANFQTLAPLMDAARSARVPLYENATALLSRLALRSEYVQKAVVEMAVDPRAHVRFNAILCLGESHRPPEFALKLVEGRLRDDSARVREKAADWALRCRMATLLPALRVALRSESNDRTRDCIAYTVQELEGKKQRRQRAV
jgi:hypothetical protein